MAINKKVPVIVIGTGGHARVLLDALQLQGIPILGVTRTALDQVEKSKVKVPILGTDDVIFKQLPNQVHLVNGIGQVRVEAKRSQIFDRFKDKGYSFATVIHPSAIISSDVIIEEGAQIMAGVIIQTGSRIGANSIVNTGASIDHDCIVGSHVHLAPRVVLSGGVIVGNGSHLGTGAIVVQCVSIPDRTFIRANSLFTRQTLAAEEKK